MNSIAATLGNITLENIATGYIPTEGCFEWCTIQHVTHSNNLEGSAMFFVAIAYLMHILYFWFEEYPRLYKYKDTLIHLSRIFLLMFIAWYFLHIRLQII